ncbi:MAG: hypothetical protein ACR2P3_06405 [Geminicoccaceae bacterium]
MTGRPVPQEVFPIRNSGTGIDDALKEGNLSIFKLLSSEKDDGGGAGGGLTFVRKVNERTGFRSTLDMGAAFSFVFDGSRS